MCFLNISKTWDSSIFFIFGYNLQFHPRACLKEKLEIHPALFWRKWSTKIPTIEMVDFNSMRIHLCKTIEIADFNRRFKLLKLLISIALAGSRAHSQIGWAIIQQVGPQISYSGNQE